MTKKRNKFICYSTNAKVLCGEKKMFRKADPDQKRKEPAFSFYLWTMQVTGRWNIAVNSSSRPNLLSRL